MVEPTYQTNLGLSQEEHESTEALKALGVNKIEVFRAGLDKMRKKYPEITK